MIKPLEEKKKTSLLEQILKDPQKTQKNSFFKQKNRNNPEEEGDTKNISQQFEKPASIRKQEIHKSMQAKSLISKKELPPEEEDEEIKEWKKQLPNFQAQLEESLQTARDLVYKPTELNPQNIIDNFLNKLKASVSEKNQEEYSYNIFKLISVIIEGSNLSLKELATKCYEYLHELWSECPSKPYIESTLPEMAKRIAYGIQDNGANIYEDTAPNCIWVWEVINPSLLPSLCKSGKAKKLALQTKVKQLSSLIKKIKQYSKKDDIKNIIKSHDAYMNCVRKEKFALQKEKEKQQLALNKSNERKAKRSIRPQENSNNDANLSTKKIAQMKTPPKFPEENANTSPSKRIKEKESVDKGQILLSQFFKKKSNDGKQFKKNGNQFDMLLFEGELLKDSHIKSIDRKQLKFIFTTKRIKYFNFYDQRAFIGSLNKASEVVTPYTPFAKDPLIDYDMETDEEYAELTGESINDEEEEKEYDFDNDDDLTEGSKGFLVPDGYLSASERSEISVSENKMTPRKTVSVGIEEFIDFRIREADAKPYSAVSLRSKMPIKILKKKDKAVKCKLDKLEMKEELEKFANELGRMLHGSYFNNTILLNTFKSAHPNFTKACIQEKIKEMVCKRQCYKQCLLNEDTIKKYKFAKDELDSLLRSNGVLSLEFLNKKIEEKESKKMIRQQQKSEIHDELDIQKETPSFGQPEPKKRHLI